MIETFGLYWRQQPGKTKHIHRSGGPQRGLVWNNRSSFASVGRCSVSGKILTHTTSFNEFIFEFSKTVSELFVNEFLDAKFERTRTQNSQFELEFVEPNIRTPLEHCRADSHITYPPNEPYHGRNIFISSPDLPKEMSRV
jgi:hypothetical protein